MSFKDYYKLLEIHPTSSDEDVKRAFRALVKQHHPDSGADLANPDMLLEIKEAYATLGNEKKRAEYDKDYRQVFVSSFSSPVVDRNGHAPQSSDELKSEKPVDPAANRQWEVFEKFNEEILSKAAPGEADEIVEPEKEQSSVEEESKHGGTLLEKLSETIWKKPKGKSEQEVKQDAKKPAASHRPRKKTVERKRVYNFTISALESIVGTSREIALEDLRGESKVLRVKIPPETRHGTTMRLAYGKEGSVKPIQLEISVRVVPAEFFEIVDDDIVMHIPVTVREAAKGEKISVPTIFGAQTILLPSPCARGSEVKLPHHGLKKQNGEGRGDLRIQPYIALPTHLSKSSVDAATVIDEDYPGDVRIRLPKFTD